MTELASNEATAADLADLLELYRHLNPDDEPASSDIGGTILEQLQRYEGSAVFVGKVGNRIVAS